MATAKKPKNLIPAKKMGKHYKKDGSWKMDQANPEGYTDVTDYAQEHPEYVFTKTEKPEDKVNPKTGKPYKYVNKYVGIHDPEFAKDLGVALFSQLKSGGGVVRVGERKVK